MAITKVKQRASGASRFVYTATAGQTTFSGADDNSQTLSYDIGFVDVYLNGVKMVNGTDVTVNNGTSVVFASGVALNDIVDINTFGTFDLASFDTSSITSGTLNIARIADDSITNAKLIDGSIANDKLATPGIVLQALRFESASLTSVTTTTFVDTAVTLNITPSSTSNKILGIATVGAVGVASDTGVFTRVYNSTSTTVVSNYVRYYPDSLANLIQHGSHTFLDSPSSTSAQTYVIQVASDRSATSYFNSRGGSTLDSYSSIVLMEIKG